jgi:transketolase
VLGLERFGFSAPGNVVMEKFGMTAQAVVDAVHALKV